MDAGRQRDDAGRYGTEYDDGAFLAAIRDLEHPTTTAVADAVGCDRRTAYGRLQQLEAEGRAASTKAGTVLLWSVGGE